MKMTFIFVKALEAYDARHIDQQDEAVGAPATPSSSWLASARRAAATTESAAAHRT
jgi:hypothetical protein